MLFLFSAIFFKAGKRLSACCRLDWIHPEVAFPAAAASRAAFVKFLDGKICSSFIAFCNPFQISCGKSHLLYYMHTLPMTCDGKEEK